MLQENQTYQKNLLREYIQNSCLRIFNNLIYIRLSKDLAENYDKWLYNNYINSMHNAYKELLSLGLKQPWNWTPNLYVYIVPDDNYAKLLSYPEKYNKWTGGWRPIKSYDIDGYLQAYGVSQNLCVNYSKEPTISRIENNIHELTHIICNQFAYKWTTISEWLAETVPLYVLDYEKSFIAHRDAILSLKQDDIFTALELFSSEKDNSFWMTSIYPNRTCSFRYSYISSYLFVRWLLETIVEIKWLSKIWALQYFLELLKNSDYRRDWLMLDICDDLWLDSDTIIKWKIMQNKAILSIKWNG